MWKRLVIPLAAIVASAGLSACGSPSGSTSDGQLVGARLLVFEPQAHLGEPVAHAAISTERQARAFVDRMAASEPGIAGRVADVLDRGPSESEVVLVFVDGMGCDVAGSAELWRDGTDFQVRYVSVIAHEECDVANTAVVAFAVPRAKVPKRFTLNGEKP